MLILSGKAGNLLTCEVTSSVGQALLLLQIFLFLSHTNWILFTFYDIVLLIRSVAVRWWWKIYVSIKLDFGSMCFKISTASSAGVFINKICCFLALIILMGHDVREAINDYWSTVDLHCNRSSWKVMRPYCLMRVMKVIRFENNQNAPDRMILATYIIYIWQRMNCEI